MPRQVPPIPKRFAPAKQRRMDALLEKNAAGTITPSEKKRLEALVTEAEKLMADNARRLAVFSRRGTTPPPGAVPVTIWVKPEHAEQ